MLAIVAEDHAYDIGAIGTGPILEVVPLLRPREAISLDAWFLAGSTVYSSSSTWLPF